jgi:hypothetical protein
LSLPSRPSADNARGHRDDRYNRSTTDVQQIRGAPAQTVGDYIRERRDLFDATIPLADG